MSANAATTVSGSATAANACILTLVPDLQPAGSVSLSATFSSDASPQPHDGAPVTLSNTTGSATLPSALFQLGVDGGLFHDGDVLPLSFKPVLAGSNTVEATHSYAVSSTATLHVVGGVAQPITATVTLPDTTWHPSNRSLPVVITEQSLQVVASLELVGVGTVTATYSCTPSSTPTIVRVEGSATPVWSISPSPSPPGPPSIELVDVSCVSTTMCAAVGLSVDGPVIESWNGSTWAIVPGPAVGNDSGASLSGISCLTTTNCYAVGTTYEGTLIEHWNGTRWSVMSSPNPPDPYVGELSGVSCASASDCFAVGESFAFTATDFSVKTLALHWNGSTWSRVGSPNPKDSLFAGLSDVSCPTTANCTAVGSSDLGNLSEHWNGTRWSIVSVPNGPSPFSSSDPLIGFGAGLNGVSCPTATSCYAVGAGFYGPLIEHWNGLRWGIVSTLRPAGSVYAQLDDISCPSNRHCVTVGTYSTDPEGETSHALIERWNGTNWALMTTPDLASPFFGFAGLTGVSCTTAADCSAVGGSPYVDHWNGTTWSAAPFASKSSQSQLADVSCPSTTSCVAVGTYFTGTQGKTLVERWNGSSWSLVASPNPSGALDARLSGVSCTSATSCFAVGSSSTATASRALVERWNGSTWSIVATPVPIGASDVSLGAVSCLSATSCMAVGSYSTATTDKALAERWNGTSWSIVAIPTPAGAALNVLSRLSCTSSASCYAVGGYIVDSPSGFSFKTLIERWNGTSWAIMASPNPTSPSFAALGGVSCTSATNCDAVGFALDPSTLDERTLVEHWNGTSWSIVASANPTGATNAGLSDVSCPSAANCYAVGSSGTDTSSKTLVEHWDGLTWSTQATPNPSGSSDAGLSGVSCPGPATCYAVGAFGANASVYTLVERST
ncbi:MAG TPA: hypothetical protein VL856_00685 [Acidimicrobiia bacterium]|nr:hypothetical protein [Acidimicrobiia bacterium]